MLRHRLVPLTVVTVLLMSAAPATGAVKPVERSELWPGVMYERGVQFTAHGPVALSVMTGPRPNGGATTLAPILSSETLIGRETVSAMQRRISPVATVAGVNGDFSSFVDGTPSGVLLRNGQLEHPPIGGRSSLGIAADGTLDVRRVEFFATWLGAGRRRVLNGLNEIPGVNRVSLFTSAWGGATPSVPGDSVSAILFPFPAAVPNSDLVAPVVEVRRQPSVPIPTRGAVLVARGSAAAALEAEALAGGNVTIKLILRPDWFGVANAIGGGPQVVRNGAPVFRAGEAFLTTQLGPRAPRTAVGQRADGRVLLVAVDGRRRGYSVGMTNFELAQTMVRLGCVTAMALDGGGSTTMAFEGKVLNLPSDGAERPIGNALAFLYTGVYVAEIPAVLSPDGDGVDDAAGLRLKLVRPSATVVSLTAPDGTVAFTETLDRLPGAYAIPFPPENQGSPVREGRWTFAAQATDDAGRATSMSRTFRVDTTLGFLRARTPVYVPPRGRDHRILFRLTRSARVQLTVETPGGTVMRTLARRRYEPGRIELTWNGLGRDKKPLKGGLYVVRAVATSTQGTVEQRRKIRVLRVAGPKATAR